MTSICTQDFRKHGTVGVLGPSTELKMEGELYLIMYNVTSELTDQTFPILVTLVQTTHPRVRFGSEGPTSSKGKSMSLN